MRTSVPRVHPLAAFALTTAAITAFLTLLAWGGDEISGIPPLVAHILAIWLPIPLSGWCYAVLANDLSPSKSVKTLRILAAALLAPFIAWSIYFFLGFIVFGMSM